MIFGNRNLEAPIGMGRGEEERIDKREPNENHRSSNAEDKGRMIR
jgi:hypothetical protein